MTSDHVSSVNFQNNIHMKYRSSNAQYGCNIMSVLAKHIPDIGDISRLR
jgi:hypothetical protein